MANVDETGAIPAFVDRQRVFIEHNDHAFLVLHKTASGGTAQDIATFFANDPHMASTHYIVGQDGTIVQAVLEKDGAAGNCCTEPGHADFIPDAWGTTDNGNWHSISIEHVDPTSDNSTPLTDAQKQASFRLIKHICARHNIPMRRATNDGQGGIIGHNDIAAQSRAHCPGNYPWSELWAYLQGETMLSLNSVSSYFKEINSGVWQCSNGYTLGHALLSFYQTTGTGPYFGLTLFGLPKSNELTVSAHPGVVYQRFERALLVYDPAHVLDNPPGSGPVYALHIDSGIGLQDILTSNASLPTDIVSRLKNLQSQIDTILAQDIGALS